MLSTNKSYIHVGNSSEFNIYMITDVNSFTNDLINELGLISEKRTTKYDKRVNFFSKSRGFSGGLVVMIHKHLLVLSS